MAQEIRKPGCDISALHRAKELLALSCAHSLMKDRGFTNSITITADGTMHTYEALKEAHLPH